MCPDSMLHEMDEVKAVYSIINYYDLFSCLIFYSVIVDVRIRVESRASRISWIDIIIVDKNTSGPLCIRARKAPDCILTTSSPIIFVLWSGSKVFSDTVCDAQLSFTHRFHTHTRHDPGRPTAES